MPGQFIATLTKKLHALGELDDGDIKVVEAVAVKGKLIAADTRMVSENDDPDHCCIILNGFAYSSKTTPLGRRQILSLHIPGEIPDLQGIHIHSMDHDLTTLTECTLGIIHHDAIRALLERPNIAIALWRETILQGSICREWIVNVGQRESLARIAHLLLEMKFRLASLGRSKDGSFELPMTQAEWADCVGISTVHVNRVFQHLRRERMISVERSTYHVLDEERLTELGQFNSNYLH
jgi:CRP-like cAMP-binding protein